MITKFITEQLSLDALTVDDHEFILELVNSEGWLRFIGDRKIHSGKDAIDYINRINTTPNFYYWVVRLKDSGVPVGIVTFIKRNYLEHFDIGFAFLPRYNGKGYAYEAANEVLSVLKQEYPVILATTMPDNLRSIKLLTRLGLGFEKEMEAGNDTLHVYSTTPVR